MKKAAVDEPIKETCRWRTGERRCAVPVLSHCSWHRYWMRVVEQGAIVQQQYEAFGEWWEQSQPYGTYATTPGIWWADKALLWAALCGDGSVPFMTDEISQELYLRRAEVNLYRAGHTFPHDPWARLSGPPLPEWIDGQWKMKVGMRIA